MEMGLWWLSFWCIMYGPDTNNLVEFRALKDGIFLCRDLDLPLVLIAILPWW